VQPFIDEWMRAKAPSRLGKAARGTVLANAQVPVEQLLELIVPGFARVRHRVATPFMASVPGFFAFLRDEKGLRPETCAGYAVELRKFEAFLEQRAIGPSDLSPSLLGSYVAERAKSLVPTSLHDCTGSLRVFLRYLHRENILPADISRALPRGRKYKQSSLPRAIPWADVQRVLDGVDRRSSMGKRDYAVLLLLASYGLRAREVAALELDDLDWTHSQLKVPARKGGHSSIYPLSASVGEAIIEYLRAGRPAVDDRHVFLNCRSPFSPISHNSISKLAAEHIVAAGIKVPRPGSHTLRHSCVQRLVESDVSFKAIGDFVGHRRAESTLVYAKVALHRLRQLAIGDAEEAL
jgi:site-specific recombinase XerD